MMIPALPALMAITSSVLMASGIAFTVWFVEDLSVDEDKLLRISTLLVVSGVVGTVLSLLLWFLLT